MKSKKYSLLDDHNLLILHDALHYMSMAQLCKACKMLSLPDKGKKGELIDRIFIFLKTGQIKEVIKMPEVSLAKNHPVQILQPSSLMLFNGYKNDLKTRKFFKQLIGVHFHFTAFGQDWLHERWMNGSPPTYQEFANYWVSEKIRRKSEKSQPKKEWAYINFLQNMEKMRSDFSKAELMELWKNLQDQKAKEAFSLILKILK